MEPQEIIAALETPQDDYRPLIDVLQYDEPPETLLAALAAADRAQTRLTLVDVLGYRAEPEAIDALIGALADPSPTVRASAADSLGKIFLSHPEAPDRERAGAALLERWEVEPEVPVLHMVAAALGATRYEPGLPALRAALEHPNAVLRRVAGWSLEQF
jgi:HEAT repeat protein